MSEPQLTFSGLKAFTWLAQHSFRIGFDVERAYLQDNGLEIYKSDQISGRLTALTPTALQTMKSLHREWQERRPYGVSMGDIT